MTTGTVDYASSYFKYKTPTPIQGAPTNKTLKRLKQELRANASSVESDLGGGDHGFLGLVLTDAEYALVAPTHPFVAPVFPAALTIPAGTTSLQAMNLREQWKEDKRIYYQCRNVEKALQRHIQDAIEDKYLESMVDEDMQLINEDIPTVLTYLFDTYGKIPSEEVKQKESEIRTMIFHPADPMILLFNPIEKLKSMGESAGIPYTADQLLDMGLTVIRNTRDFEKALGDWEPIVNKTWTLFKSHFSDAQKQLKAIRGPTMQQAGYHHANHLAQQIQSEIQQRDTDLLTLIQTVVDSSSVSPSIASTDMSSVTETQQHVNAVQTDTTQLEILKLLQQLQQSMRSGQDNQGNNQGNNRRGRRTPKKTPDDASFNRTETEKYCWTHGACGHHSAICRARAPGHQTTATFEDKMGGSKAFCPSTS